MIFIEPIRYIYPINKFFFKEKTSDDLVVRVAKIVYKILEHLFNLIETGVNYLMHDPKPKPLYVRYKWSFRITIVALSIIGAHYGMQHLRYRTLKYLNSFFDGYDSIFDKAVDGVKNLLEFKDSPKSNTSSYIYENIKDVFSGDRLFYSNGGFQLSWYADEVSKIISNIENVVIDGKKVFKNGLYDIVFYILNKSGVVNNSKNLESYFNLTFAFAFLFGLFQLQYSIVEPQKLDTLASDKLASDKLAEDLKNHISAVETAEDTTLESTVLNLVTFISQNSKGIGSKLIDNGWPMEGITDCFNPLKHSVDSYLATYKSESPTPPIKDIIGCSKKLLPLLKQSVDSYLATHESHNPYIEDIIKRSGSLLPLYKQIKTN